MTVPEAVREVAEKMARKYPENADKAVKETERRVKALPEFKTFVDDLVRSGLAHIVWNVRHVSNVQMRRDNGGYGTESKVGVTDETSKAFQSVYDYFIGGRVLGMLKGEDLSDIAAGEESRAEGHAFNGRLLRALQSMVPADQTVKDAVPERKLKQLFKRLNGRKSEAA